MRRHPPLSHQPPTPSYLAASPDLEDGDLMDIIIHLQEHPNPAAPSATVTENPGTLLRDERMNVSPSME